MKPWRPLDEMDHDEIRRYSHELLKRWQVSPFDDEELQAYLREAAERMDKLGMDVPRGKVNDADREE